MIAVCTQATRHSTKCSRDQEFTLTLAEHTADVVGLVGIIAFLVLALAPLLNAMQNWPRTQAKASERHKNLFESFWRLLKIPRSPLQKLNI